VPEHSDVDVHHVPADRATEEPQRAGPADGDDGEAGQSRAHRDQRRQKVQEAIPTGRYAAGFEEQLEPVRGRLEQSPGPDAIRPRPLLQPGLHLALEEGQVRETGEETADHDGRLDQGHDDDFEGHAGSLQRTRSPRFNAEYGGRLRTSSAVMSATDS